MVDDMRVTIDAPWHDLQLYPISGCCATRWCTLSFQRVPSKRFTAICGRYLSEELVPLALFSTKVPERDLSSLKQKLFAVKPPEPRLAPHSRFGAGFGKPKFPECITESTRLSDLVGPDSWFFFQFSAP